MVKFVRLPFYEQSDMKRLSRTNPRFIGMPRGLNACPDFSGAKWLCVGVSTGVLGQAV